MLQPPYRKSDGLRRIIPVLLAAAASACAVGPDYTKPELTTPDRWAQELTQGLVAGEADLQTWWEVFADPVLSDLIARAEAGSLNLEIAYTRIEEARGRRGIARGDFFPEIEGKGDYERRRAAEDFNLPTIGDDRSYNFYSAGLGASWEVDVFGRIRRSVEAANAGIESSVEDYRDVLVSLLADVATTYVDIRTLQRRLGLAERNVQLQRETFELTRERNNAGLVGDLDVAQAARNLAVTEAFVPTLRAALVQSINRLGVLLGEPPGALHAELKENAPIPVTPAEIAVGVPFDLVRQRPDLRRAERELAAQSARIGITTADLYPRFSILGTFSFDATSANGWFTGDAMTYGVGPSIRWNLFQGGQIRSQIQIEKVRAERALIAYEQVLLFALQEVEDTMVAYREEHQRLAALQRSVDAALNATELVQNLYRAGLTDFQNVLDTERSLFQQQDALSASEGAVASNLVRVYRAFGGGWSN